MKSILLATANTDHVLSLTDLLQKQGFFVIPAGDSDLALAFLRNNIRVDAVIADHDMEGFWSVMAAVRSHGTVAVPVIVMSDRAVVTDYLDALSAGAFDFFIWPIRGTEFLRIVLAAMDERKGQPHADGYRYQTASPVKTQTVDSFL